MDPDDNFFSLLHSVSEALTEENLRSIRYLCKDVVSYHKSFDSTFIFLQHLKSQGWINALDMTFLAEILYRINRHDLLKRLPGVKNRKDYEENFLISEASQNFTAYRIACFSLTEELTSTEFKVLKNFCKSKISPRNFQRAHDIYTLVVCLEEEDIVSDGDLQFLLNSLRHLDNQTPYKTFEKLSCGDHSFLYPRKQGHQPQQVTRPLVQRRFQSLPNFTDHAQPAYGYQQQVHHASFHNGEHAYRWNNGGEQSLPATSFKSKSSNSSMYAEHDGCAYPPQTDKGSKTFSEQEPPSKMYPQTESSKSFLTDAHTETVQKSVYPHQTHLYGNDDTRMQQTFTASRCAEESYTDDNNAPLCMASLTSSADSHLDSEFLHSVLPSHVSGDYYVSSHSHAYPTPGYSATVDGNRQVEDVDEAQLCDDLKANGTIIDHYSMESKPSGMCVIINNASFEGSINLPEAKRRLQLSGHSYPVPNVGLKNRIGSDQDVKKISELFKSFGFETNVHENLASRDMKLLLENVSKEDHSRYDCFVLIIMSHGALGSIYGIDGMPVRFVDIKSMFKPGRCPSLLNKPKIFFFQACQGEQSMDGHAAPVADVADIETDGHVEPSCSNTPSEADFLICYSTVPGYISYRSRSTGSFFINLVAENLFKLHQSEDVLSIMANVNAELAKHSLNQTSMPVSTLRKKVFFHKK